MKERADAARWEAEKVRKKGFVQRPLKDGK